MVLLLVCAADFLLFAVRQRHGTVLGFVTVRQYNPLSDGNGNYHFAYQGVMDAPCVRTLLPHQNRWPCWWVQLNRDDWDR